MEPEQPLVDLDDALKAALACPVCQGELGERGDQSCLLCTSCGHEYPVVRGIPILLARTPTGDTVPGDRATGIQA